MTTWTNAEVGGTVFSNAEAPPVGDVVLNGSLTSTGLTVNGNGSISGTLSVTGALTFSSTLTLNSLTNTRIPIAGVNGLLGDNSGLTFASNTLTAHTLTVATGNLTVSTGQVLSAAGYGFTTESNAGLFLSGGFPIIQDGGTAVMLVGNNAGVGVLVAAGLPFSFGSSGAGSPDVFLFRDAANTLAQRNGTNAQQQRWWNTFTSLTNGEYFSIDWQSVANVANLWTVKGSGGGTARALRLGTDATARWEVGATLGGFTAQSNYRFAHGTSALATTATEGYFHLQSCAGAPTGVPATIPTGQVPMVIDSTNSRIYAYIGGAWKSVAVA